MQEVTLPKQEIDVLRFEHTAIIPVTESKPKRKKKSGMKFEHKVIIGLFQRAGLEPDR